MKVKYYSVKTVGGHVVKITEKKETKRDASGRFIGKADGCGCWRGKCPFLAIAKEVLAVCMHERPCCGK